RGLDDRKSWDLALEPGGAELKTPGESGYLTPHHTPEEPFRWIAEDGRGEGQADYRTASEAIRLLEQRHDRPFFVAVGFVRPHTPYVAPRSCFDRFPTDRMPLPSQSPLGRKGVPPLAFQGGGAFGRDDATTREAVRAYNASVCFMDAQLGRIL